MISDLIVIAGVEDLSLSVEGRFSLNAICQ